MTERLRATSLAEHHAKITHVFDLGSARAPLVVAARGEQGVIWRLETNRGVFAVKELLLPLTAAEAAADVSFLEVAAAQPSFVSPVPMRTTAGSALAEIAGRQVRVHTWVDIREPDTQLDPARIGTMLAALHAVGDDRDDPVDPWYTAPVTASRWEQYARGLATAGAPCSSVFEDLIPSLLDLENLLEAPTNLRTCHRDLWADNVRATPDGDICVIDWDNSGPCDPSHELGMVLFEFGYESEPRARALYDAYLDAGGPGRLAGLGSFTMLIAQFGHFYEMAVGPWLDQNAAADDVAWALDRLDELRSRQLTVQGLNRMLHATLR